MALTASIALIRRKPAWAPARASGREAQPDYDAVRQALA